MPADTPSTVLVIDDESIIRFALRATLEDVDFEVHEAIDGQDGLTRFRELKPACTILDLRMPRMDGHGFLKSLSEEEIRRHPVIILTGHGDIEELQACYDQGAMLFLRKPFNDIELLSAVRSAVASHHFHSSQRREREQEIERLSSIIELTPLAVAIVDGQGCINFINPSFRKLLPSPQPIHHRRLTDIWPELETAQQLLDGGQHMVHRTVQCAVQDHDSLWMDVLAFPLGRISEDEEKLTTWMLRDITQQRTLEDRYHRAQRLESVGTMAAGVAHDFNNILNIILSYAGVCELDAEPNSQLAQNLKNIEEAAMRARDIVKQLLTFSRQASVQQTQSTLNLGEVVQASTKLIHLSLKGIQFTWRIPEIEIRVDGNATELQQVISNLCINAWHATRDQPEGAVQVTLEQDNGSAIIRVSDNGHGISSENLTHIFDPFFTTKPPGEGEGLGLSVVHGIITRMGGRIECQSSMGAGTTFSIHLPLVLEDI